MSPYRQTYWLYAIIAKAYGRQVKIKRDDLRKIYGYIHRHGMELTSHNISVKQMQDLIVTKLREAGYKQDKDGFWMKQDGKEKRTVSLNPQAAFGPYPESLHLWSYIYK